MEPSSKRHFHWTAVVSLILWLSSTSIRAQVEDFSSLPMLKRYTAERAGSYDRSGANDDGNWQNPIKTGETRAIAELDGPGIIKHIWVGIAAQEPYHLKRIVLRMYWDGEKLPAVEAPIGDFFGLNLGKYYLYESGPLSVGSQKALNCYFPMPFRKSARITVTNEGERKVNAFYYNIDWEKHTRIPEELAYFHAEYRQGVPTPGRISDWTRNGDPKVSKFENRDGRDNYVLFEAEGEGHYVGATHGVMQNQGDWWGEGDAMIFIDDTDSPKIIGTGTEDYYLGAWCYGGCGLNPFGNQKPVFAYKRYGNPVNGGDNRGAEWIVYRFHTDSPIPFKKSIRMTLEHGHGNHRSDNWYTVAYWYQKGVHRKRAPLPAVLDRIPRLLNVEGPTVGRP